MWWARIAAMLAVIAGCDTSPLPELPPLGASARFTIDHFVIENQDSFDWKNCELIVNGKFSESLAALASHESTLLHITEFATADGERFNLEKHKFLNLELECDTPGGRQSSYLAPTG